MRTSWAGAVGGSSWNLLDHITFRGCATRAGTRSHRGRRPGGGRSAPVAGPEPVQPLQGQLGLVPGVLGDGRPGACKGVRVGEAAPIRSVVASLDAQLEVARRQVAERDRSLLERLRRAGNEPLRSSRASPRTDTRHRLLMR